MATGTTTITTNGQTFSVNQDDYERYRSGILVYYGGDLVEQDLVNRNMTDGQVRGLEWTPEEFAARYGIVAKGRASVVGAVDEEAVAQDHVTREQNVKNVAESQTVETDPNDWRVRLHLGTDANYLYRAKDPGILAPLAKTDGIIFPYTPEIAVQYNADYENYDLPHSNYRGYFYKGSQTQNILLTAVFTANDVEEANYMLAAMHFLRSATKMFYGQDLQRGMPPPIVFLTGLGEYQFNNHPCAITMMNYNLPNDVDYIPCGNPPKVVKRLEPTGQIASDSATRKSAAGLGDGAYPTVPTQNADGIADTSGPNGTYTKATYVPTKILINFTMIPIQTRDQVSNEFSLKDYASGKLLRKGFW